MHPTLAHPEQTQSPLFANAGRYTANTSNALDQIESITTSIRNVTHLAALYADMTGHKPIGVIQVDSEALSSTMRFFADELVSVVAAIDALHDLLARPEFGHANEPV